MWLELANTLITHNASRHPKALRASRSGGNEPRFLRYEDEVAEAEAIVGEIARRIDAEDADRTSPSDIAILFRTNEQPRAFETELRRFLQAQYPQLLETIEQEKALSDDSTAALRSAVEAFKKTVSF